MGGGGGGAHSSPVTLPGNNSHSERGRIQRESADRKYSRYMWVEHRV